MGELNQRIMHLTHRRPSTRRVCILALCNSFIWLFLNYNMEGYGFLSFVSHPNKLIEPRLAMVGTFDL